MKNFFDKIRRIYRQFRLMTIRNGWKKSNYLKKQKIFNYIGDNCYYHPNTLPAEPFLVTLKNNVVISAGVRLVTHSMVHCVFNKEENTNTYLCPYGEIIINDNVYIGADAIINYGVKIGKNCIIAAGAIVTKDVPDGEVWGGIPAKKIGTYEEVKLKNKNRSNLYDLSIANGDTQVIDLMRLRNDK